MSNTALPILDLADVMRGDAGDTFRNTLRDATHSMGFFYLRHGIPRDVTDRLFTLANQFFALPQADKLSIEMTNSPHFRGYTRTGGELTQGAVDWREQIDVGSERQPVGVAEPAYLRLEGPNQWPAALPELQPAIEAWIEWLSCIGMQLKTHTIANSMIKTPY